MTTKSKIERQKPKITQLNEHTFIVRDSGDGIKLPKITLEGDGKEFENDVRSMLYSLLLICKETGQGSLKVTVKNGAVFEMSTEINQKR